MIDAAKSENVILKLNFSYRTYLEQYQQRKKNQLKQYTDEELYTNSSKLYNPYTAIPGFSIHERGAAFDFSVNGGKSAAYKWLVKNAYKFGFYRTIPSEMWHFEYQPWTYRGGVKPNDMFKWVKKEDSSWLGLV
jgi:LAS superfamily LD-carboxypeptidase LdcB